MYTVHIIGASLGCAVGKALKNLPSHGHEYTVKSYCKPGLNFLSLKWPNRNTVKKGDILLIFPFGNDLVEKHYYRDSNRYFHLTKFVPKSDFFFSKLYEKLLGHILIYESKVVIVSSFYRFLCSCHRNPGLVQYIRKRNSELFQKLGPISGVTVLDQQKLVSHNSFQIRRDIRKYQSLLKDGIHFVNYQPIAENLLSRFSSIQNT